jgi:acetylornithine deacetylase/succinyl-diaminopimelate desuccinylase-like protein
MRHRIGFMIVILVLIAVGLASAQVDQPTRMMAHDIFKQLIEINTTDSVGSTTLAAQAMADRLLAAGFPKEDVYVGGPNPRKGNLVARIHGTGAGKPILFICHTDVVEARREDWTTDPFKFVEQDGYYYGRGTSDIKDGDAILVTTFIRLKKEGYRPDRDLIVALTADEEGGTANGVDWLLRNHRDMIDAEYIVNPDGGDSESENGKPLMLGVQASEKLYADYTLEVKSPGGHSSLPEPDNAIYTLSAGLLRLAKYEFPLEMNEVTRGYFESMSKLETGQTAEDLRGALKNPPDEQAIARLSAVPSYNAQLRTTCVATRLDAGHANNALPARARANVNCRIFPGHSTEDVRKDLIRIIDDPRISIAQVMSGSVGSRSNPPSPLNPEFIKAVEITSQEVWPGVAVVPIMSAGASDGAISRAAGIPTYGLDGVFQDINENRAHGKDERIPVKSFYEGVDFYYRLTKALSSKSD